MTRIDQPWLHTEATQRLCQALTAEGAEIFFVGGCVRNALLGVPVSDLDLSTDAEPGEVMELASRVGIKAVPTGLDHGTVTLVLSGTPFEITSFRKDVATDGRRAVVQFSKDITEDAKRRDFTMNALYARPDGSVVDPLDGLGDLTNRRVRFIGSAEQRIREDYLRALRYFRFHAYYGDVDRGFDAEALAAISANLDGLTDLSRERIGAEMQKLLAAHDPAPAIAAMRQSGVLGQVLPGVDDRILPVLIHLEAEYLPGDQDPDAIWRLAALGGDELRDQLRLSKAQAHRLICLREAASSTQASAELGYRLGATEAVKALLLRAALFETHPPVGMQVDADRGAAAVFPVKARDLMPDHQGEALGKALKILEEHWIKGDFLPDRDALINLLN